MQLIMLNIIDGLINVSSRRTFIVFLIAASDLTLSFRCRVTSEYAFRHVLHGTLANVKGIIT